MPRNYFRRADRLDARRGQADAGQAQLSQVPEQIGQFHVDQCVQLSVRQTGVAGLLSGTVEGRVVAVRAECPGDLVEENVKRKGEADRANSLLALNRPAQQTVMKIVNITKKH